MSLRHAGLLVLGASLLVAAIVLLARGDTTTGVMSGLFALVMVVVPVAELAPDGSGVRLVDGALVIGVSRTRRMLLLVGSVLFAAVGALLVLVSASVFALLAGALCVLVFGTFAVVGLWQMRGPAQLVITPRALRWDQGAAGAPVAWDDIARVGMMRMSGAYCARDPRARETIATEATLRRLTGGGGSRRGARRRRGGPRPR